MKGKILVIHKDNNVRIPKGIYIIKKVTSTRGGYGHGPHDYYPPYKTFTITNTKGDVFIFRNANYVRMYIPQDCYKIIDK